MFDARLAAGVTIRDPVAVVVAHADDEVLSLGSRLPWLEKLRLVHLTDGAPRDMEDAQREGFTAWQQYAAARRRELYKALQVMDVSPASCVAYDVPDKEVVANLVSLTRRLVKDLAEASAVFTHPYEHGHPDHDGAAFAVHAACAVLGHTRGHAPPIFEFASYHLRDQQIVRGAFWPAPGVREHVVTLTPTEQARKSQAIACFVTQQALLAEFPLNVESLRSAPAYDFTRAAPPGLALYDGFGWSINSTLWRQQAQLAQEQLGLEGAL
jgi:LmbE family N-acetylglucosaminyl deacetylase